MSAPNSIWIAIDYQRNNSLSKEDCNIIQKISETEKKLENRSAEDFFLNAQDGCVIARHKQEIIWCFFLRKYGNNKNHENKVYHWSSLYKDEEIFERATLRVKEEYRKHGVLWNQISKSISQALNEELMRHMIDKSFVSITSNPVIVERNSKAGMIYTPRTILEHKNPELRNVLCEDDLDPHHEYQFLLSQKLHSNITL